MGMDADMASYADVTDTKSLDYFVDDGVTLGENGVEEYGLLMGTLARLDTYMAYSNEKLVNLERYVMVLSLGDSELGELLLQNANISEIEIKKALAYDLLLGYLDSEVTDLGQFLNNLQSEIVEVHQRLNALGEKVQTLTGFQEKLHTYECTRKDLQEQLSGLAIQLFNMHGTLLGKKSTYSHEDVNLEGLESDRQIAGQQRLVLRMLDKSLSGELDLEEQLSRSKEREEELKSKLSMTNTVVSGLESFTEFALERLLQAEHSSVVFMGMAKEMMTHLPVLQFQMQCAAQREEELKSKLQRSLEQLQENKISLMKIEDSCENLTQRSEDETNLEEKVRILEEKLKSSESKVQQVNASYEVSQAQLSVAENTIEALEGEVYMAETRAHIAEETFATLTEENIELREEVTFLKDGDSSVEKISLLENQVRELEFQLQTAKSSSDASQANQNMLYKAIWDMELLVEELRSKVSKADIRADNAEKECLTLAETNLALNKEISYLKSNGDQLEGSLIEAKKIKVAWVKDINNGAKLVTELVMELASERERIQKQMTSLVKENKILLEELRRMRKIYLMANQDDREFNGNDSVAVVDNPIPAISIAVSAAEEHVETSMTESNQVDELEDQDIEDVKDEAEASISSGSTSDAVTANFANIETENKVVRKHTSKKCYSFAAIIVVLFFILALNINWQEIASLMALLGHHYLGFQ